MSRSKISDFFLRKEIIMLYLTILTVNVQSRFFQIYNIESGENMPYILPLDLL